MVYYRRNLLVISLSSFLAACALNQFVPFLPMFIKELGVTSGVAFWTGVTLSVQTFAMIVMLPYWGKLADKYGRKLMTIRAGIFAVLIYLGMSYCQTLWQLLFLRVLNGALTGYFAALITLVSTNTPQTEAPRSVALVQSALAFGTIAGPPMGSILVNWVGYRGTMVVSSIMVAVGVLLIILFVEERHKVINCSQPTSLWQDFRLVLKTPVLVTTLYSDMTDSFMMTAGQPILILYIQEIIGAQANLFAGLIFALPGMALVLTNYCWLRLGERYTFKRFILLGLTGTGIFLVLQGLVRDIWWFAIAYFLVGLCSAAVSPNTAGFIAAMVETDFRGRAFALQHGLLGLAAANAIRVQMSAYKPIEATISTVF
jgi:DHA1 family multidrug resistance protein-like MFS transporter